MHRRGNTNFYLRPRIGLGILTVLVLTYGIVLWLIWFFSIFPFRFARFQDLWLLPGEQGFSTFEATIGVTLLLLHLVVIDIIAARLTGETLGVATSAGYGITTGVLLAIGYFLYSFATHPMHGPLWATFPHTVEPMVRRRVYVGRVLNRQASGCSDRKIECWQVELETGEHVLVSPTNVWGDEVSEIVAINELVTKYSGEATLSPSYYIPVDDAELFWRGLKGSWLY